MSENKTYRPKARIPRGFRDRGLSDVVLEDVAFETIARVYKSYGFEPLDTPALEYTDALGKFLPDQDRPNEGVFSLKDDDGQWLSLRYDLTAPLARYVAENYQNLPKPFRRYQYGPVWRNEKPGPGRYREFVQFDADTVGSASSSADAELLMMTADVLEELRITRGEYVIGLNSRKLLDGVLEAASIDMTKRSIVLRAIDKMDRLGMDGVRDLLGKGRKDESGDFTKGAELSSHQAEYLIRFVTAPAVIPSAEIFERLWDYVAPKQTLMSDSIGEQGLREVTDICRVLREAGYFEDRIRLDTGIVRGLDYYTGAVFEAQPRFPIKNEKDEIVVVGSLAGGGRYDDLVARFTGQKIPATGISIGMSRLVTALKSRGLRGKLRDDLVIVLVPSPTDVASSFAIAREIREAFRNPSTRNYIRVDTYTGDGGMKAQLKYADKRGAAVAIIEGGDERAKGEVTLKDIVLGAELAKSVESRAAWVKDRPAQISVKRSQLVPELRKLLAR